MTLEPNVRFLDFFIFSEMLINVIY